MWNPSNFDIKNNSLKGEWFNLTDENGDNLFIEIDGKKIESRVMLIGPKTPEGIKIRAEAERAARDYELKVKKADKKGEAYLPSDQEIADNERRDIETIKSLVKAWEGIPNAALDGEAKCTDEEKERIFAIDFFRTQIIQKHLNPLNFIKKS